MSAISFPQNPNIGEIFTNPNTGSQFQWTGSAWSSYSAPLGISATGPAGTSGTSGFDGVTGPQGIQGEVGPVGPAGLNWRSMWSATGDYSADDSVGYTGASWFNILGLSGSVSNLPPDQDPTHWALLASQGSPGQQGPQGIAGTNGTSGSSGSSGSSGLSGVNGTSGTSGSRGATGSNGAAGATGATGAGVTGATGATGAASLATYATASSYVANDIVVYNQAIYQANSTIPGNTIFTIGTTGATWKQIGVSGVSEYGTIATITNAQTRTLTTMGDVTGGSFTVPSAGTWEINWSVYVVNNNQFPTAFQLFDTTTNTAVPNSTSSGGYSSSTGNSGADIDGSVIVTVSSATTFKLQWAVAGGTSTIYNNYSGGTFSALTGTSSISYKKIAGWMPAIGQTTSYISLSGTQNVVNLAQADLVLTTVFASSGIPYNTSTGVFTLTAGVTYEFTAQLSTDAGGSSQSINDLNVQFVDATTNVAFGAALASIDQLFTGRGVERTGVTNFFYTPTTNQTVKARVTYANASFTVFGTITIKQLGTTNTSAFTGVISNGWNIGNSYPSGTIVVKDGFFYQANAFIAAGTAFTLGTSGATWSNLGMQQAEYGEVVMPTSGVVLTTTAADILSFTLPTAGIWEVEYIVRAGNFSIANLWQYSWLANSSNTVLSNSEIIVGPQALGEQQTSTGVYRITTSGSENFKLRGIMNNGTGTIYSDGFGRTSVKWKKISGFLPLQTRSGSGSTTISAITTPPTKPSVTLVDYNRYLSKDNKWTTVQFRLSYTSSTGGANGSGQYIFSLPSGISFDTTVHPVYTGDNNTTTVNNATTTLMAYAITASGGIINAAKYSSSAIYIIPYTATTYRAVYAWGQAESTILSSAFGSITGLLSFNWQFDIVSA